MISIISNLGLFIHERNRYYVFLNLEKTDGRSISKLFGGSPKGLSQFSPEELEQQNLNRKTTT
jgi:hypothetical protein